MHTVQARKGERAVQQLPAGHLTGMSPAAAPAYPKPTHPPTRACCAHGRELIQQCLWGYMEERGVAAVSSKLRHWACAGSRGTKDRPIRLQNCILLLCSNQPGRRCMSASWLCWPCYSRSER